MAEEKKEDKGEKKKSKSDPHLITIIIIIIAIAAFSNFIKERDANKTSDKASTTKQAR